MTTRKIIVNGKTIAQSTASYNDLVSIPSINGVKIQGDVTNDELNIYNKQQVDALIASASTIKIVPVIPSTPLPNTEYYVGPNAQGKYDIYMYDKDLNRIHLGESNNIDLSIYQEKQPYTVDESGKKIYDIGHNDGETDGRTLVSHNVASAIDELDRNIQKKQNINDTALKTSNKTIVDAINELKTTADTISKVNFDRIEVKGSNTSAKKTWIHIGTFMHASMNESSNNITLLVVPNFNEREGITNYKAAAPCLLSLHAWRVGGYDWSLTGHAAVNPTTTGVFNKNGAGSFVLVWDSQYDWSADLFYCEPQALDYSFKAYILSDDSRDITDGFNPNRAPWATTTDPTTGKHSCSVTSNQMGTTQVTTS